MNKVIKILLCFFCAIDITAGFGQTSTVKEGCIPLEVSFQAPSGSTTYYWNFKDGASSNKANPTNIFSKAGTYDVTFKNSPSGPTIGTIQIKVYPDPIVNMSVSAGCAPLNAQFLNKSTIHPSINVLNYVWVFGDGSSSTGIQNATHLYPTVGLYDVSFSIETQFPTCNKTVIFNDVVDVITPPIASFTTTPANTITCNNSINVAFQNTSTGVKPLKYSWNMGNGKTFTTQNPAAQLYTKGSYNASLTVSYPSIVGCTASATKSIGAGKPAANISFASDTVCVNSSVLFTTTSAGIRTWTFDAGTTLVSKSANGDSAFVTYSTQGKHTLLLTVTSPDGLCTDSKIATIYADKVTATLASAPSFSCSSPSTVTYKATSNQTKVTFNWSSIPGADKSPSTLVKKYFATDTSYYGKNKLEELFESVTVTSLLSGCTADASKNDTLWLPNALMSPDTITKGCAPLVLKFSDSSTTFNKNLITQWTWLFGDGTSQTKTNNGNVTHTYSAPGEYLAKLIVTTERGCKDTSYATLIEVGRNLSAQIDFSTNKTSVCPGESINLTALPNASIASLIDGYHFNAENNSIPHCSNGKVVPWSFNHEIGPQDISLTVDYNGCFSTTTKTALINVKGAIAKIDYAAECNTPYNYTFIDKSKGATTIAWDFGDGTNGTAITEIHNYTNSSDYAVSLTATNPSSGCPPTKDYTTIKARKIKASFTCDSLLCINKYYPFNANSSIDVQGQCHNGYTWQFSDPLMRPSTSQNSTSTFSFSIPGYHTIQLITKDINGCRDTTSKTVKVFDMAVKPTVDDNFVCTPVTLNFSDLTTSDTTIVSWTWNFMDTNSSTLQNPSHTYLTTPTPPTYDVLLTAFDILGCFESEKQVVNFYKPFSSILLSDQTLCLGDSVTISATDFTAGGSNLSYIWDFGNGTSSTSIPNKLLYNAEKVYSIRLKFQEVATGCKDSTSINLSVQNYPIAGIDTNVDTLAVLCAPQNVFFKDSSISNSPLTHKWNFGNGQTSTAAAFGLFYAKGIYTATHIVTTTNGCSDTTTQQFNVFTPEGNFSIDKNTICKGDTVTFTIKDTTDVASYTWAFGDGNVLDDQSPVKHAYNFHPPSGYAPARLIIKGFDGICPVELQKNIFILQVVADFDRAKGGIDSTICFNDGPFNFTNKSTLFQSYFWDFGDGTSSTTQLNPAHNYATPGVYPVTLYVANATLGCKDTVSKIAVVYSNPSVTAIGDTACQGEPISLNVVNPIATNSYSWIPTANLSSPTAPSTNSSVIHSTVYQITETNPDGCTDAEQVLALVIEPIRIKDFDTLIIVGDKVTLPVFGPKIYQFDWTPKTGLSCLDCNYPIVMPLEDINYHLIVTDKFNCFNSDFDFTIQVKPETFVKVPTMFTPNGDGNNDVIFVKGWGIKELLEFQIFNRWGQMVYSSTNIEEGWDGRFKNEIQGNDVYVFKVKALNWRNEEIKEEGYINLIR